jgi:hypothetical protein
MNTILGGRGNTSRRAVVTAREDDDDMAENLGTKNLIFKKQNKFNPFVGMHLNILNFFNRYGV